MSLEWYRLTRWIFAMTMLVTLALLLVRTSWAETSAGPSAPAALPAAAGAPMPCDSPRHHEFDFWLGDWQVLDADSGALIGFDRVQKELRGCVVQQDLVWLTDQFRRSELDYRMSGRSVSVVSRGRWLMLWMDTYGTAGLVEGGAQEDGSMVFETTRAADGRFIRGVWQRGADGTVRNTGYVSDDDKHTWKKYFDYLYKPNR